MFVNRKVSLPLPNSLSINCLQNSALHCGGWVKKSEVDSAQDGNLLQQKSGKCMRVRARAVEVQHVNKRCSIPIGDVNIDLSQLYSTLKRQLEVLVGLINKTLGKVVIGVEQQVV
ncbi:hypothetical protein BPOR_0918g00020 [Botrytis porri]|uniref:Uncharacterized protein n=1 Tax=Botrytis porri TaxID=87229 RepID=A0A4Z1KLP1_9HELO|nr:hypothetical protein BPOR_0918g00020 [Botrytis porri]